MLQVKWATITRKYSFIGFVEDSHWPQLGPLKTNWAQKESLYPLFRTFSLNFSDFMYDQDYWKVEYIALKETQTIKTY